MSDVFQGVLPLPEVSGVELLPDGSLLLISDEQGIYVLSDAAEQLKSGQPQEIAKVKVEGGEKLDDLEDAAWDGEGVWLISSHSRNKRGRVKKKRHKIAYLKKLPDSKWQLQQDDWLYWKINERFSGLSSAMLRTPAQGGFNIEGVVDTPQGDLLIGLRAPTATREMLDAEKPEAAQLLKLVNPRAIFESSAKNKARLDGKLIQLDLNGQGIRGLCRDEKDYWILSNLSVDPNHAAHSAWRLWQWDGSGKTREYVAGGKIKDAFASLDNPEAVSILQIEDQSWLLIIEDRAESSPYILVKVDS